MGDAIGNDCTAGSSHGVPRHLPDIVSTQDFAVLVSHRTDEYPGPTARDAFRDDAAVLQSGPAQFEHETLLRIHADGLVRRDIEESRVESIDLVQ
ncbi:hypothetical protein OG225_06785 [Nocardia sp. NBC_01377]